jgi:hypothetical protein
MVSKHTPQLNSSGSITFEWVVVVPELSFVFFIPEAYDRVELVVFLR